MPMSKRSKRMTNSDSFQFATPPLLLLSRLQSTGTGAMPNNESIYLQENLQEWSIEIMGRRLCCNPQAKECLPAPHASLDCSKLITYSMTACSNCAAGLFVASTYDVQLRRVTLHIALGSATLTSLSYDWLQPDGPKCSSTDPTLDAACF